MFNFKDHAELAGITKHDCATACVAERCVITGRAVCAHPCKTGVQYAYKSDLEILGRYADACKILGVPNKHEIPL